MTRRGVVFLVLAGWALSVLLILIPEPAKAGRVHHDVNTPVTCRIDPDRRNAEICTVTRNLFPPDQRNRIVYLHGRSQLIWPIAGSALPWTKSLNVYETLIRNPRGRPTFQNNRDITWTHPASDFWSQNIAKYDGSSDFENNSVSSARQQVKRLVKDNCSGSDIDSCVILCYSAGCPRMLLAFEDLEAELGSGWTQSNKVAWVTAVASAAGGSELADFGDSWIGEIWESTFGDSEKPIDDDLKVSNMRTNYAFMQNSAPSPMYHSAGRGNICTGPFGWNWWCGNSKFPGNKGDGAVPVHSACGFSDVAQRNGCCQCKYGSGECPGPVSRMRSKYTNRFYDHCGLKGENHIGMFSVGVVNGSTRIQGNIPPGGSDGTNTSPPPPPPPPGPGPRDDCGSVRGTRRVCR